MESCMGHSKPQCDAIQEHSTMGSLLNLEQEWLDHVMIVFVQKTAEFFNIIRQLKSNSQVGSCV